MSFRLSPSRPIRLFLPHLEAASWRQGEIWASFACPGCRFSHLCNIQGGEGTAFFVHNQKAHSLNPLFTHVLPYPCSPSQPPLSLFFPPPTRDFYHSLKKVARVYVECHPTSQLSQLVALKASGKKTASVDLTVKTSLPCSWFCLLLVLVHIIRLLKVTAPFCTWIHGLKKK